MEEVGLTAPFNSIKTGQLQRIGIIDVGSNSVRLVVFDGPSRSPAYFFNEKVHCGLGASLVATGKLDEDGRQRALRAIKRFALLAEAMELKSLIAVATAAVREATDGQHFCDEIEAYTGIKIHVASGEREAMLAAQGVFLGWPNAEGIVCDLGGSSTEFVEVSNRTVGKSLTARVGHLPDASISAKRRRKLFKQTIVDARLQLNGDYETLYLVGGSWRVIARLDMERTRYPLKVLNEYRMTCESALATVDYASRLGIDRLRAKGTLSPDRLRGILAAGMALKEIITQFEPRCINVSAYGIREGLLYERMPEELRSRDPLIEACLYTERSAARLPGFGDLLYEFVRPLFKSDTSERMRLIRAACLLHDVTWQAHPDYRAEISFDNATRANLGGIDHQGRVFIALALFHRYRKTLQAPSCAYVDLLNSEDIRQAEILGRAMRFGAMFSATSPEKIGRLKFRAKQHVLTLIQPESFKDIFGEVVEARFKSLASAMDCEPVVETI